MPPAARPMPPILYLLSLCNLVIGTGAFVPSGILVEVAQALQVDVAAAGQAITVYALATAVLAPLALMLTGRWPRRRVMWLSLLVFAAGNAVCALAGSLAVLLAGRLLMGIGAMFTAVAAGLAVSLVEPARRSKALALAFLGISLSYVIGVPLGAWAGLHLGWQWPIAAVAACAAAAALLLALRLPAQIDAPGASLVGLRGVLARGEVLRVLALTLSYFVAIFLVFSYIGPVLQSLAPMSGERVSLTLMAFGVSGVVGTLLGGWAGDRYGARRTLSVQLTVLGLAMAVIPFTGGHYPALLAALLTWGTAGFGMMAPQQSRLAALAPEQAPLLLSLNTSMLYMGTAIGAALGGLVAGSLGFARLSWVGVPFIALGLLLLHVGVSPRAAGRAA